MRFSPGYLICAAALFLIEVCIAKFVHDRFVRPHLGDVLVVILIYCCICAVGNWRRPLIALGVFLFACAIEVGQGLRLVDRLGLGNIPLARVVLGTSFDPYDFVAYLVGCLLCLAGERLVQSLRL